MVKVYNHYPHDSRGVGRTARMMEQYAPLRVKFVDNERESRLIIIHVIGRHDHIQRMVDHAKCKGKRIAIVQHVLLSSRNPNTSDWQSIWNQCELVWSAYNLPVNVPFYHAPFGCDPDVFSAPLTYPRRFVLGTQGTEMSHESMQECYEGAIATGREQFHCGTAMRGLQGVEIQDNISDGQLASCWGQCEFVSGLRKIEGFELPAVEGLLCGARPILYDLACYRQWYEPWGVFIPESKDYAVRVKSITDILKGGAKPITPTERADAARFFDWKRIINGFWEMLDE